MFTSGGNEVTESKPKQAPGDNLASTTASCSAVEKELNEKQASLVKLQKDRAAVELELVKATSALKGKQKEVKSARAQMELADMQVHKREWITCRAASSYPPHLSYRNLR